VDPAIITNSSAGDLMVIRNIANLVPPYDPDSAFKESQAAIEFAVCYLAVDHIIVMGHSRCAGIRSLLTRLLDLADPVQSLDQWTVVAEPAAREVLQEFPQADLDEQACQCSRKALVRSLENLESYPCVSDRLEKQALQLHGWYFNLANGDLERYLPAQQRFASLY
jgi:carbonic anhydrase